MKYAAACVHVKDEEDIIEEWLAFHIAVGFEHLFIIDNGSSDKTKSIIKNFRDQNRITYLFQPKGVPAEFSTIFIKNYGDDFRWMAFIDADEFLYPSSGGDIRSTLSKYENASAVGVYWQIYGSNGHEKKPDGLTIENFTMRAKSDFYINRHVKSIVNPRKVVGPIGSHIFHVEGDFVDELNRPLHIGPPHGYFEEMIPSHEFLRINHYHVRSRDQYDRKRRRGYFGIDDAKLQQSEERFENMWKSHNMNEEHDDSAMAYSRLVKFYTQK